ncbi:MAG: hypothetical protein WA110_08455 [Anaerolineaceae bacterium]
MNNFNPFEKKIRNTYHLSPMDPAFSAGLEHDLNVRKAELNQPTRKASSFRWAYAFVPVLLVAVLVMSIGPQKVWAQIQSLVGYVPGLGIVDTSSPFRVLAEPVSQTRDGVTVNIDSALLSEESTRLDVEVLNIPPETHFSKDFGAPICTAAPYLLLPDGARLDIFGSNSFAAIPEDVNEATYVMPCISNHLLGKAPENWELPLRFIPAPADLVVYPVTVPEPQVSVESPEPEVADGASTQEETETGAPNGEASLAMIDILNVIDKPGEYIVTWGIPADDWRVAYLYTSCEMVDASGKVFEACSFDEETGEIVNEVMQQYDLENNHHALVNTVRIPKDSISFPVSFNIAGVEIHNVEDGNQVDFEFDAGPNPKLGDKWEVNQNLTLGSVSFTLESVEVHEFGGYKFNIDGGDSLWNIQVDPIDIWTNFHGGSQPDISEDMHFYTAFFKNPLPTGKITVRFLDPQVIAQDFNFTGSWSPE